MIFDYEWREQHAAAGDFMLTEAGKQIDLINGNHPAGVVTARAQSATALAAIAQAHYAAANIRQRPKPEETP